MYTKRELRLAKRAIQQMAQENHVTVEEARREMQDALEEAMNNPDPAVQARWKEIPCAGEVPTVEEVILWVGNQLKDS